MIQERTSRSIRNSMYASAIAIQKLRSTPSSRSIAKSTSSKPVVDRKLQTGVRSWKVSKGVGDGITCVVSAVAPDACGFSAVGGGDDVGTAGMGHRVNDTECDGFLLLNAPNALEKNPALLSCGAAGGNECGASTN